MPRFRFTADPNTAVALFDPDNPEKSQFLGLVVDESQTGFGAVFVREDDFKVGQLFTAKVGHLGEVESEVRWSERLAEKIVKVGFMYLDLD